MGQKCLEKVEWAPELNYAKPFTSKGLVFIRWKLPTHVVSGEILAVASGATMDDGGRGPGLVGVLGSMFPGRGG
jgi:hypothetical protein